MGDIVKAKKILFKTSGIIKIVVSALALILFLLLIALSKTIIEQMLITEENFETMITEMLAVDPSATFLQDMDLAQFQNYMSSILNTFCAIAIFVSVAGIVLGIFNLIFAKKYDKFINGKLWKKVTFTVVSLIFYPGIVTNILTIIALFLKDNLDLKKLEPNSNTTSEENL